MSNVTNDQESQTLNSQDSQPKENLQEVKARFQEAKRSLREAEADLRDARQTIEDLRRENRTFRNREPRPRVTDVSDDDEGDDDDLAKQLKRAVDDRRFAELSCAHAEKRVADLEDRLRWKNDIIMRRNKTVDELRAEIHRLDQSINNNVDWIENGRQSRLESQLARANASLQRVRAERDALKNGNNGCGTSGIKTRINENKLHKVRIQRDALMAAAFGHSEDNTQREQLLVPVECATRLQLARQAMEMLSAQHSELQHRMKNLKDANEDPEKLADLQKEVLKLAHELKNTQMNRDRQELEIKRLHQENISIASLYTRQTELTMLWQQIVGRTGAGDPRDNLIKTLSEEEKSLRESLNKIDWKAINLEEEIRDMKQQIRDNLVYADLSAEVSAAQKHEKEIREELERARKMMGEQMDSLNLRHEERVAHLRAERDRLRTQMNEATGDDTRARVEKSPEVERSRDDLQRALYSCSDHVDDIELALQQMFSEMQGRREQLRPVFHEGLGFEALPPLPRFIRPEDDDESHRVSEVHHWISAIFQFSLWQNNTIVNLIRIRDNLRREVVAWGGRIVGRNGEVEREEFDPRHWEAAGDLERVHRILPHLPSNPLHGTQHPEWPEYDYAPREQWPEEAQAGRLPHNIIHQHHLEKEEGRTREEALQNLIDELKRSLKICEMRGQWWKEYYKVWILRLLRSRRNLRRTLRNSGAAVIGPRGFMEGEASPAPDSDASLSDFTEDEVEELGEDSDVPHPDPPNRTGLTPPLRNPTLITEATATSSMINPPSFQAYSDSSDLEHIGSENLSSDHIKSRNDNATGDADHSLSSPSSDEVSSFLT